MDINVNETYDATSIQQLTKIITGEDGNLKEKNVFPVSVIQSIFDGITGTRLDNILSFNNYLWVPFAGAKDATRLKVSNDMRRKGLIISFKDLDNVVYTQRYIEEDVSNETWIKDSNWEEAFVSQNDIAFINQLKKEIIDYIEKRLEETTGLKFKVVNELPAVGDSRYMYLVLSNIINNNMYTEYIWIDDEKRYEIVGSTGGAVSEITSTITTVGELSAGTDISGLNAMEILNLILDAEYAPLWIPATAFINSSVKIKSVGDTVYNTNDSVFTITGEPPKASTTINGNAYIATGGNSTNYIEISNSYSGGETIEEEKGITYTLTRSYSNGTDIVRSNKNNPTNKTANNSTTKLSDAVVNNAINPTNYTIRSTSSRVSVVINYYYPVYLPSTSNGSALVSTINGNASHTINCPASNSTSPIKWQIPNSFTNVVIEYYDSVTQSWGNITNNCTTSTITKNIGSTNLSISYKEYIYSENAGSRQYRIRFTRQ